MAEPGFVAAAPAQLHLRHARGSSRIWRTRIRKSRACPDAARQRHADGIARSAAVMRCMAGWAKLPAAIDPRHIDLTRLCPGGQAMKSDSVGKGAQWSVPTTLLCTLRLCPRYWSSLAQRPQV